MPIYTTPMNTIGPNALINYIYCNNFLCSFIKLITLICYDENSFPSFFTSPVVTFLKLICLFATLRGDSTVSFNFILSFQRIINPIFVRTNII